jgi:hypothetical protein
VRHTANSSCPGGFGCSLRFRCCTNGPVARENSATTPSGAKGQYSDQLKESNAVMTAAYAPAAMADVAHPCSRYAARAGAGCGSSITFTQPGSRLSKFLYASMAAVIGPAWVSISVGCTAPARTNSSR